MDPWTEDDDILKNRQAGVVAESGCLPEDDSMLSDEKEITKG